MQFTFVSHSTCDDAYVSELHDQLVENGIAAWVDHIHGKQSASLYK